MYIIVILKVRTASIFLIKFTFTILGTANTAATYHYCLLNSILLQKASIERVSIAFSKLQARASCICAFVRAVIRELLYSIKETREL